MFRGDKVVPQPPVPDYLSHYSHRVANTGRRDNLSQVRDLLQVAPASVELMGADTDTLNKAALLVMSNGNRPSS